MFDCCRITLLFKTKWNLLITLLIFVLYLKGCSSIRLNGGGENSLWNPGVYGVQDSKNHNKSTCFLINRFFMRNNINNEKIIVKKSYSMYKKYNKPFKLDAYNYTHNRNFGNRPTSWSSYYNRNLTNTGQAPVPKNNYQPFRNNPQQHMNRYHNKGPVHSVNTFHPGGVNYYNPQFLPVPYVVNQFLPGQNQPNQFLTQAPGPAMYNHSPNLNPSINPNINPNFNPSPNQNLNPNPNVNVNVSSNPDLNQSYNPNSKGGDLNFDSSQELSIDPWTLRNLRERKRQSRYTTFEFYTDVTWWNDEKEDGWPGTHKVKPGEIYYGILHYYFTPYDGLVLLVDRKVEGSISITDLPPNFLKTTIKDAFKLDHLIRFKLKDPMEFDEKGRPKFIPIFGDTEGEKKYNFRSRVRGTPIFFTNTMGVFKLEDNKTYAQVFLVNTGVYLTYPIQYKMIQFFKPGELIEMEVIKGPTEPRAFGYLCRIPFDSNKALELRQSYKMVNDVEFENQSDGVTKQKYNDHKMDQIDYKETPSKYEPKFYVNEYEKMLPYESESCTLKDYVRKLGGNLKVVLGYLSLKTKSVVNPSTVVSKTMAKMLMNFIKNKNVFDVDKSEEELEFEMFKEANDSMVNKRAPVVCIIGGPGEGKSALYEAMCKVKSDNKSNFNFSRVEVGDKGDQMTLFDTPGNELLTPIRNNILKASDLAIVVISAETGVSKYTKESVEECRKNNIPFLFVLTKFDLSDQKKVEDIITELYDMGLVVEQMGGELQMILFSNQQDLEVNRKHLLESVILESSVSDKINFESPISQSVKGDGFILDSGKNKNYGFYSLVLMKNGGLKKGDYLLSELDSTKIKSVRNREGELLEGLKASESGYVYGFEKEATPNPGDKFQVFESEDESSRIAEENRMRKNEAEIKEQMASKMKAALDFLDQKDVSDDVKYIPVIIRCDVKALVEPVKMAIEGLKCVGVTKTCKYKVVDSNIGNVTQDDASVIDKPGLVVAYNTPISNTLENKLNKLNLKIIKQDNIDDVLVKAEEELEQFLGEKKLGRMMGRAEILKVFDAAKKKKAAGCVVNYGRIQPFYEFRVVRENKVLFYGKISSLRRTTEEVSEILETESCGITFEGFNDFKVGDVIEAYTD